MSKAKITLIVPFAALLTALALGAPGCTKSGPPAFRAGEMPLQETFATLPRELEIISMEGRLESASGPWTAKLNKTGPEATDWVISGNSLGIDLLDRRAHGGFIEHLVSTLKTLQVTGEAAKGPLESFGLQPPAYAIRWPGGELRIGGPGREPFERFAQFLRAGQPEREARVYTVKGSALKMLEHVESFASVRQQALTSPLAADDVDEVEILRAGKPVLYAQREGDVWTDRKHKPVKREIDRFLETLTHARIQEFVDDRAQAEPLAARIQARPLYSAVLKDRKGRATRIDLAWSVLAREEHLYGAVTGRPGAFRMYRELLSSFEILF